MTIFRLFIIVIMSLSRQKHHHREVSSPSSFKSLPMNLKLANILQPVVLGILFRLDGAYPMVKCYNQE